MRKLISNNTGKAPEQLDNTDVDIHADGEGGIYLSICWHEMKELGSVAIHLPAAIVQELVDNIQRGREVVD